jgi:hypothetical protein
LNIGHLGSKTWSHRPNMQKTCLHSTDYCYRPNVLEIGQKGCYDDFLGQVWILVTWVQKYGNTTKIYEKRCYTPVATVLIQMYLKSAERFFYQFLGQVRIWITWDLKLGHTVQNGKKLVNTLWATAPVQLILIIRQKVFFNYL